MLRTDFQETPERRGLPGGHGEGKTYQVGRIKIVVASQASCERAGTRCWFALYRFGFASADRSFTGQGDTNVPWRYEKGRRTNAVTSSCLINGIMLA